MRPTYDFEECAPCAAQPGTARLCPSCLNNRATIENLRRNHPTLREKLADRLRSLAHRIER